MRLERRLSDDSGTNELRLDPIPSVLIESMRDIGYSFQTALADIVDNCIAAGCTTINIVTSTQDDLRLAIVDDGIGLERSELLSSMRMGSSDPRAERDSRDLGRFGLGMKTASFSQCRRLTVVSRKNGRTSAFSWDLDHVVAENSWNVIEINDIDSVPFIKEMNDSHGTLVLWEKLDRVCGDVKNRNDGERVFTRLVSEAEDHLSLVFHRFLSFERGYQKISIQINGRTIEPLDPFNSQHSATIAQTREPAAEGVYVQSFTLPHASKYQSKAEYDRFGLPGGYLKNQGIYLYRARRLIIYGTWFNLAKKTALTQLCRVKIDIDNNHDEEWKIDVKKASAQLPENVREVVRSLIGAFSSPSRRVYKRRGAVQTSSELFPLWKALSDNGTVRYEINRMHPVLASFEEGLDSEGRRQLSMVYSLIEAGLPMESIYYELSNDSEKVKAKALDPSDLSSAAREFFALLKSQGQDEDAVLNAMKSVSMFGQRWDEVLAALEIEEQ